MADTASLVSSIGIKVRTLIAKLAAMESENERYRKEINELKQKIAEQLQDIQDKERQLNVLNTVNVLEHTEGTAEAKAKVSELLREIDKCIGLLNV
jgi:chromosome segregation ATPase